ncbi:hypothetical protein FJZ48_02050 [Candidatus Uhrbacteria bacterium]|nr:hypothetical protein [Candidatus Uhrbacteria bacterium]
MPREMPITSLDRRPERRSIKPSHQERFKEKLVESLKQLADQINREFVGELGAPLLHDDGTINMDAFSLKKGGPFRKTKDGRDPHDTGEGTIEYDKALIERLEADFAAADSEGVQKHFGGREAAMAAFRERQSTKLGVQLEMALTIILHKVLGSEFLVLRSSKFDDYKHGVDHLIVDRLTGNVVCSFDNVNETEGLRNQQKMQKVIRRAADGGTQIKYGITFSGEPQKILRTKLSSIPTFSLALSQDELKTVLHQMNYDVTGEPSSTELQVFDQLMDGLELQCATLQDRKIASGVRMGLMAFGESLTRMRALRANQPSATRG